MSIKTVYQTLEDRDTELNQLEDNGPYSCNWKNSWLGEGYYFWDTFIDNAHWWGKEIRAYKNGYIICKAICDFNDTECLDLVGNTEHLEMLHNTYELMKSNGLANKSTSVKRVIEYLKNDVKKLHYDAIRVYGLRSKNYHSRFSFTQTFESNNVAYLDYKPPIQICFFKKKSLNLRDYHIVYPDKFNLDFV